ncbi:MAG TPA: hypothetical protein VGD99_13715 [Anaerolineae bacterium]|jgi:hypothetical protein
MDKKRIKELLADHADRLVQGQGASQPELSPEERQELDALLNVAERVKSTLTPVTPPDTFEQELKRHLLTTAHLRRAQGYTPPNPARDLLVVAIAIGCILSFTGVLVALKLWRR